MNDEDMDKPRVIDYWQSYLADIDYWQSYLADGVRRQVEAREELEIGREQESLARRRLIELGVNA